MEQQERDKILQEREIWYNNVAVTYELVKALHHRELALIDDKSEEIRHTTRYIIAFSKDYLLKHFERFEIAKTLRNLYMGVATLKNIPVFSYNLTERRNTQEYENFNRNFKNFVTGYDLFLDFDFEDETDFKKNYWQVLKTLEIFNQYKLPFYCLNSSAFGTHYHIPAEYMPIYTDIDKLIEKLNNVIYNLKGIYKFSCLDNSVIDIKRICRLPYSYSCKSAVICLPLSDEQIKSYSPSMVKMNNVLASITIRNRGNLLRTHGLTDEILKQNTLKFIKDFE